jgi:hypothetical protein
LDKLDYATIALMDSIMLEVSVNRSLVAKFLPKMPQPTRKNAYHAILRFILFILNPTALVSVQKVMLLSKMGLL